MRLPLATLLVVLGPPGLAAQNPMARMGEVRQAIVARDTGRAFALLDTIAHAVPDHPNVTFLRAHALGAAGRLDDAEREIRRLLAWDSRYAQLALRDSTVAALRGRFPGLDSIVTANAQPLNRGTVWATIPERDLVAEGTAYDPATRSVLIGSLHKAKILAIDPSGVVSERVPAGASGLRSVVGIHVDSARGVLWVASNARFDTPTDSTPSALVAFDARTGAFRARLGVPPGPRFLNDVTTGPDGTVYVTDSRGGKVFHATPGAGMLSELTSVGTMIAPNGITISPDGQVLFVSDADHIRAVDLRSGNAWRIAMPAAVSVSGIDGLAFDRGALIAHHPLAFWRIARYTLDPQMRRITGRELIEANSADGRTSTTGEIVGTTYYFIGNSQIDRMNQRTIDPATMEPIRIYRAELRAP